MSFIAAVIFCFSLQQTVDGFSVFSGNKIAIYNRHSHVTRELLMLGPEAFGYKEKTSTDSIVFEKSDSFGFKKKIDFVFQKLNSVLAVALFLFSFPTVTFARNSNVISQSSSSKTGIKGKKKEPVKIIDSSKKIVSKSSSSVSKISPNKMAPKNNLNTKSNSKTIVDVVVKKDPQTGQLTKVGIVLVAGTVIGTLLLGDDKNTKNSDEKTSNMNASVIKRPPITPSKSNTKKQTSKSSGDKLIENDDNDLLSSNRVIKSSPVKSIRLPLIPETTSTKSKGKSKATKKDLFEDDEENDSYEVAEELEVLPSPSSPSTIESSPISAEQAIAKRPAPTTTTPASSKKSISPIAEEKTISAQPTAVTVSTSTPSPPLPPPPAEKKGLGIFNRLFPKQGAGRPTTLHAALAMEDTAAEFRRSIAYTLLPCLSDVNKDLFASDLNDEDSTGSISVEVLAQDWVEAGLTQTMAAEAFADVASSMLVVLVDQAISQLGLPAPPTPTPSPTSQTDNTTTTTPPPPPPVISTLDEVIGLAGLAGELFPQVVGPSATLSSPVQYNGAAKRGKVEDLFYEYYKTSMSDISALLMSGSSSGSDDDNSLKIQKLQVVLGIKEAKRNALEQKAMKDLLLSGGGNGGLGDLSGMFEALSGGAKGNSKEMAEQLKSVMGSVSGSGIDSLEDLDKMSPDELADMSKSAVDSVKASLKDGSITKSDVLELEKIMGTDVESLVKMMKQSAAGALADKSVGGEVKEMLQLFSELLAIKKGNK